jgi:hypothetical protein
MDVERLHVVLQQSFSPDAAIRKPAEDTMRNLKNVPGSVQLLLQVIAEKQVRPIWSESPQERKNNPGLFRSSHRLLLLPPTCVYVLR